MAALKQKVDNRARRHALNMKTTLELRQKLEARAAKTGRVLTHEVEQQLIRSFEMEDQIAALEGINSGLRDHLAEYATDPHEAAAVKAFALALRMMQRKQGKSWREGGGIPYVVCGAIRRAMAHHTRNPLTEGLQPAIAGRDLDAEVEILTDLMQAAMGAKMPPLPEIEVDPISPTDHVRQLLRIKEKVSGQVLETIVMREGRAADLGSVLVSPAYLEAIERYRPRHHELETEGVIEQVLMPDAYLTGQEEATRLMAGRTDALRNVPASSNDRARFDEIMSDRPRESDDDEGQGPHDGVPGDASPASGEATPVPASDRRTKARAKA